MAVPTRDTGKTTSCMDLEGTSGVTVRVMDPSLTVKDATTKVSG